MSAGARHTDPTPQQVARLDRFATWRESLDQIRGDVVELKRLAGARHYPSTTQLEELAQRMSQHLDNIDRHFARGSKQVMSSGIVLPNGEPAAPAEPATYAHARFAQIPVAQWRCPRTGQDGKQCTGGGMSNPDEAGSKLVASLARGHEYPWTCPVCKLPSTIAKPKVVLGVQHNQGPNRRARRAGR